MLFIRDLLDRDKLDIFFEIILNGYPQGGIAIMSKKSIAVIVNKVKPKGAISFIFISCHI